MFLSQNCNLKFCDAMIKESSRSVILVLLDLPRSLSPTFYISTLVVPDDADFYNIMVYLKLNKVFKIYLIIYQSKYLFGTTRSFIL